MNNYLWVLQNDEWDIERVKEWLAGYLIETDLGYLMNIPLTKQERSALQEALPRYRLPSTYETTIIQHVLTNLKRDAEYRQPDDALRILYVLRDNVEFTGPILEALSESVRAPAERM